MSRKMEHVEHALRLGQSGRHGLEDVAFVHNALPGTDIESISLETALGDIRLKSPLILNAMTGGSAETERINRELAEGAAAAGIAMAVGSQMSALKNPEVTGSYRIVREMNPSGVIFGNLGSEATAEQAQRAVDMLEANGLQIHLNVMQELIMPEGDRSFSGALARIETMAKALTVPIIAKEVGFGISADAARQLFDAGVSFVDCGGAGGTNFAAIENARRSVPLDWLNDWGIPTSASLLEVLPLAPNGKVIASGGIASAIDACKALALGAAAVGMAGAMLRALRIGGVAEMVRAVEGLHNDLRLLMTALGASRIPELRQCPLVIRGETRQWCQERGIDTASYARRSFSLQS